MPSYFFRRMAPASSVPATELSDLPMVAMLIASGRAVMYPVYKTTYERND
jgi:hypothetical protein